MPPEAPDAAPLEDILARSKRLRDEIERLAGTAQELSERIKALEEVSQEHAQQPRENE